MLDGPLGPGWARPHPHPSISGEVVIFPTTPMQSKGLLGFFRSKNIVFFCFFWPKSAPGRPGKGPRLGPRSICTVFQPGRPILRLFRAAFRTPCDCIGDYILAAPSRGRVRTASFLRTSTVLARSRSRSGGGYLDLKYNWVLFWTQTL